MALEGHYLGFDLRVSDIDVEDLEYFEWCGKHEFRLQRCSGCGLLRYPPTTACPYCTDDRAEWVPVEGKGVLYSYGEVHHAIQPQFKEHLPYHILLAELDTQRGQPGEYDGLRILGNLVDTKGNLASEAMVRSVGIGTRLRIVFVDVGDGLAIPQWTVDDTASQPSPWRYAQE